MESVHHGEICKKAITKKEFSYKNIAIKMSLSTSSFYARLRKKKLPLSFIVKLGKVIQYDFRRDLIDNDKNSTVNISCFERVVHREEMMELKKKKRIISKYIDLLEKYNILLDALMALLSEGNKRGSFVSDETLDKLLPLPPWQDILD